MAVGTSVGRIDSQADWLKTVTTVDEPLRGTGWGVLTLEQDEL